MATFCVEIPDEEIGRIVAAICSNYHYQAQIPNPEFDPALEEDAENNSQTIDNPENPYQFTNRMTRDYLVQNTMAYEIAVAKAEAMQSTAGPPTITDPAL
tara:strand:- start:2443 stop:2742 length:300 start_codon:yes stop_codon:yes gene_type:complete